MYKIKSGLEYCEAGNYTCTQCGRPRFISVSGKNLGRCWDCKSPLFFFTGDEVKDYRYAEDKKSRL